MSAGFNRILMEVSRYRGIPADELVGQSREKATAAARHELCYLARHVLRFSNAETSRRLSNRDLTTIQHSVQVIASMRRACRRYDDEIASLIVLLKDACASADSLAAQARLALGGTAGALTAEDRPLAVSLVAVDGILSNPDLNDADARAAALHMLNRSGPLFSQGEQT